MMLQFYLAVAHVLWTRRLPAPEKTPKQAAREQYQRIKPHIRTRDGRYSSDEGSRSEWFDTPEEAYASWVIHTMQGFRRLREKLRCGRDRELIELLKHHVDRAQHGYRSRRMGQSIGEK